MAEITLAEFLEAQARRRREAEHDEGCWRRHHACAVELLEHLSLRDSNTGWWSAWPAVQYWRRQALDARRVIKDQGDYIRYLERELLKVRKSADEGRRRVGSLPRAAEVTK